MPTLKSKKGWNNKSSMAASTSELKVNSASPTEVPPSDRSGAYTACSWKVESVMLPTSTFPHVAQLLSIQLSFPNMRRGLGVRIVSRRTWDMRKYFSYHALISYTQWPAHAQTGTQTGTHIFFNFFNNYCRFQSSVPLFLPRIGFRIPRNS